MKSEAEDCVRKRIVIGGDNYYLLMGSDFVMVTCPFENRPEKQQERLVAETLCAEITALMGGGLCSNT